MSLVIKKYFGDWCNPCKSIAPMIRGLVQEYPSISLVEIDIDEERDISEKNNIRSVPTIVFEKNGIEVGRLSGIHPKTSYTKIIENNI